MRDPNQKLRYTTQELGLIKGLFAENDELLYIIRKSFLQFELTEQEKEALKNAMNEQVMALMVKSLNPWLDPDSPLFQMTDLVLGLGADIKTLSPDGAWPFIKAKEIEINYISQQLKILGGSEEKPTILLSELGSLLGMKARREDIYKNILARNFLLSFIDSNINQLKLLAGLKSETIEETLERLKKDSNK